MKLIKLQENLKTLQLQEMFQEKVSNKHVSVALASESTLRNAVLNPQRNILCVNDVRLSDKKYEVLRKALIEAFEQKFPVKSRFEL